MAEQKATNVHWHEGDITRGHRGKILGHKGATLWFTGLSGSGKSTVAVELEGTLHEMGVLSYRLDGDNVRMGINKNLGFSAEDRTENIRRIGEVAKLFVDSGVIALSSFISPYRQTATRCAPCTRRRAWILSRSSSIAPWKRLKAVTPRACTRKPGPARSRTSPVLMIPMKRPKAGNTPAFRPAEPGRRSKSRYSVCCASAASSANNQETVMIKPHGSDELNPLFVYDTEQRHALVAEAETLPSILLNSAAAANAVMLGGGYFNPLTGYMNLADALSVAEKMHTVDGLFFPGAGGQYDQRSRCRGRQPHRPARPQRRGQSGVGIMDVEAVERSATSRSVHGGEDFPHPG